MEIYANKFDRRIELIKHYAHMTRGDNCKITSVVAKVITERRKGGHRVRIHDLQVTAGPLVDPEDQPHPVSPELEVGILGSDLAHSYLVEADFLRLTVDSLEIDIAWRVAAQGTSRVSAAGSAAVRQPRPRISYVVRIASPATEGEIVRLAAQAEKSCPVLNCLRSDQTILGAVEHRSTAVATSVSLPLPPKGITFSEETFFVP